MTRAIEIKPGQFYIAPVGTLPLEDGWKPLGHTTLDNLTMEAPMTEKYTSRNGFSTLAVESNNGQTVVRTSAATLPLNAKDIPAIAQDLFQSSHDHYSTRVLTAGKANGGSDTIVVGYDGTEARVYSPETEQAAQRNLNFALANLAAYNRFHKVTKPALEKAKAEEAVKKAKIKEAEAEALKGLRESADGLAFYNKQNNTTYGSWASIPFMGSIVRGQWIELAKADKATRKPVGIRPIADTPFYGGRSIFADLYAAPQRFAL